MTSFKQLSKKFHTKYWRLWDGIRIYFHDSDNGKNLCFAIKINGEKSLYMLTSEKIRKEQHMYIWFDISILLNSIDHDGVFYYFVNNRLAIEKINDPNAPDGVMLQPVNLQRLVYKYLHPETEDDLEKIEYSYYCRDGHIYMSRDELIRIENTAAESY